MKRTSTDTTGLGQWAEQRAEQFLVHQGLIFRQRNFNKVCGEIDLIMEEASTLVFVEVKLRGHRAWVGALESIDRRKQRRLIKTANWYLQHLNSRSAPPCRFDVVAITHNSRENTPLEQKDFTIEWIKYKSRKI